MTPLHTFEPAALCSSFSLPSLIALSALLSELLARIGAGPSQLFGYRADGPLDKFGVSWLFGLLAAGTAFLGLAMAGVFSPVPIAATTLGLAAAGGGRRLLPGYVIPAVRAVTTIPPGWLAALGLAALILLAKTTSSGLDEDCLIYHFGFPWQCLQNHRVPLDNITFLSHLPLPVDLVYAVPILLSDDRLARLLIVGAFASGSAFIAGRTLVRGNPPAAWLTPLLVLSAHYVLRLPWIPKNDLAAAAFLVTGAIMWREGPRVAGAFLLGGAVATKLSCGPLALAWIAFHPPRRRQVVAHALLFLLPLLPWIAKSWVATGNPTFPALWQWFDSPFWGPVNQAGLETFSMMRVSGTDRLQTLPAAWLREMWQHYTLFLFALPPLFLAGGWRTGAVTTLGCLCILRVGGLTRYLVPAIWLMAIELAAIMGRVPGNSGRWLRGLVALVCLLQVLRSEELQDLPWRDFLRPAPIVRREDLTTYATVIDDLRALAPRKTLLVGAWRTYLLPGRALFNGFWGESPIIWSLVRASSTEDELRRKFRQLGVNVLLQNFVSGDQVSWHHRPFAWNDRMLKLYAKFCRHRLSVLRSPSHVDRANGGFYVLTLDLSPRSGPARPLLFLPGAETAIAEGRFLTLMHRFPEAEQEFERVLAVAPSVGHFVTHYAMVYAESQRWRRAHDLLAPFANAGLVDNYNLPTLGMAAVTLGLHDEAVVVLKQCLVLYDTVEANRLNLASAYHGRAQVHLHSGRLAEAEHDLELASAILIKVPTNPSAYYSNDRRHVAAHILGTRADLQHKLGRDAAALILYRKALKLGPELPEAQIWKLLLGSHHK